MQNLRRQFLLGLRDLGDLEGRSFQMEDRNADGHLERLPTLAADLVRLPPDRAGRLALFQLTGSGIAPHGRSLINRSTAAQPLASKVHAGSECG